MLCRIAGHNRVSGMQIRRQIVRVITLAAFAAGVCGPVSGQQLTVEDLVRPSTIMTKDGRPVTFAVHGFLEFKSLSELFPYIDSQVKRFDGKVLNDQQRRDLARDLLRRGIESHVISMVDERPLEVLITHTSDELRHAIASVREPVP